MIVYLYIPTLYPCANNIWTKSHPALFEAEIYVPPPFWSRSGNKRLEDFRFCFGSKVPNLGGCMLMLGHLGPSSIHCNLSRGLGHRKGIDETTENVQRELQDKLLATWQLAVQMDREIHPWLWTVRIYPDAFVANFTAHSRCKGAGTLPNQAKSKIWQIQCWFTGVPSNKAHFKKNMTATSESFKTFLLSKRLTKTSRRLSSGLQKLGDKSSDS